MAGCGAAGMFLGFICSPFGNVQCAHPPPASMGNSPVVCVFLKGCTLQYEAGIPYWGLASLRSLPLPKSRADARKFDAREVQPLELVQVP